MKCHTTLLDHQGKHFYLQFARFAFSEQTHHGRRLGKICPHCDEFSVRRRLVGSSMLLRVPIVVHIMSFGWTQNEQFSWQICGLNQWSSTKERDKQYPRIHKRKMMGPVIVAKIWRSWRMLTPKAWNVRAPYGSEVWGAIDTVTYFALFLYCWRSRHDCEDRE